MESKFGRTLKTSTVEKALQQQEGTGDSSVNVTLDLDTANSLLILSDDLKSVRRGHTLQCRPANPKRFEIVSCVLGCEGFASGKHSWEVEVDVEEGQAVRGLGWAVGVARESVSRKGLVYACPREGIWVVGKVTPYGFLAFTSPEKNLSILGHEPKRIQIFVDYKEGQVEFFDGDTGDSIFAFRSASFSGERLHPYFRLEWFGQLKCRHTPVGQHDARRASPALCCSGVQELSFRSLQCGMTSLAAPPTPYPDLCTTHLPLCTECTEKRNLESPNTTDPLLHAGSVQSTSHSTSDAGMKPAAEARRPKERQGEAEKISSFKIKNTSSLGAGGNTQPRRAEEEGEVGAVALGAGARELQLQNCEVPPLSLEGSTGEKWEGMLMCSNASHKEKGKRGSLKTKRDSATPGSGNSWISSEHYPLFALIPLLPVLIIIFYDLLS